MDYSTCNGKFGHFCIGAILILNMHPFSPPDQLTLLISFNKRGDTHGKLRPKISGIHVSQKSINCSTCKTVHSVTCALGLF